MEAAVMEWFGSGEGPRDLGCGKSNSATAISHENRDSVIYNYMNLMSNNKRIPGGEAENEAGTTGGGGSAEASASARTNAAMLTGVLRTGSF